MEFKLFDLYSDYLLSSFAATTATGMSALVDKTFSHDQVSRMLKQPTTGAERLVEDSQVLCAQHAR